MRFLEPELLVALVLVPAVAIAYVMQRRRRAAVVESAGALSRPVENGPGRRRHVPIIVQLVALTVLLTAFARPEAEIDLPRVELSLIHI